MKATKTICGKGESTIVHGAVTRWLEKFCLGCQNLDDQARSDNPNTMESEAGLKTIEVNPASSARRVSGEFGIS